MKKRDFELWLTIVVQLASITLAGSISVAVLLPLGKLPPIFTDDLLANAVVPLFFSAAASYVITLGGQTIQPCGWWRSARAAFVRALALAGAWAMMLLYARSEMANARVFYLMFTVLFWLFDTLLYHTVCNRTVNSFYRGSFAHLAAVVATRERVAPFLNELKTDWTRRIVAVALMDTVVPPDVAAAGSAAAARRGGSGLLYSGSDTQRAPYRISGVPVVSDGDSFLDWVRCNALDEVFFCLDDIISPAVIDQIEELESMGIQVHTNLPALEKLDETFRYNKKKPLMPELHREINYVGSTPVLTVEPAQPHPVLLAAKRAMDLCGAVVGCLITAVLFVTVGIAIKLESPGPVIFAQPRVGKNGRIFKMYKFRSMRQDAEEKKAELMDRNEVSGLMFKMDDDPRLTKVGRFIRSYSLDEFPQFFNVLKGDMSMVGTRPPTLDEYARYSSYHKRRLSMTPGITGLWQVSGRSNITDFEEVVQLDCQYIDNWSLGLDIRILFRTVVSVLRHEGAK